MGISRQQSSFRLAHFPTIIVLIGFITFWFQLITTTIGDKILSISVTLLVGFFSIYLFYIHIQRLRLIYKAIRDEYQQLPVGLRVFINSLLLVMGIMMLVIFYAHLLPPHLQQEYDALNYHITLPRQHIITNTFAHIPWSSADLFYIPLDFALAPFWLVTTWPNKIPQLVFFLGMLGMVWRLTGYFSKRDYYKQFLAMVCVLSLQVVAIQAGTAMMELVAIYLFLASIDSFLQRRYIDSAVEFAFYFCSKSFIPLQVIVVFLGVVFVVLLFKYLFKYRVVIDFDKEWTLNKKALIQWLCYSFVFSVMIALPMAIKSLVLTGTPIFPFFVGLFHQEVAVDFYKVSQESMLIKDAYGQGRSILDFIYHVVLLAIPQSGVNNIFDYPLGLVFWIILGLFVASLVKMIKERRCSVITIFIIIFWLSWWFGSQQSRFLLPALIVMVVFSISAHHQVIRHASFRVAVLVALLVTAVSVVRAHKSDWGKSFDEVIRPQDKQLLLMAKEGIDGVKVVNHVDVAFANFPVEVRGDSSIFVLPSYRMSD